MLTTKFERDQRKQQRRQIFVSRSSVMIGIGKHDGAQREFLALVDVVFDEDAATLGSRRLERRLGSIATIQDTTVSSMQDARKAMNTHMPRAERSK